MNHEEIQANLPAYAFGATDADEARQVAAHIGQCPECSALLAGYRALSDDMLYAAPAMAPRAGADDRLRQALRREESVNGGPVNGHSVRARTRTGLWERLAEWGRDWGRAWPVAAVALLGLVLTNVYWFSRIERLETQVAAQAAGQVAVVNEMTDAPLSVLASDNEEVRAKGVVYAADHERLFLLCAYYMPALPEGMAYQVWLIRDGQRDSGGLFRVSQEGYGVLLVQLARPLAEYDAVGITVEPAAGSPGPTSPRVIGGEL